MMRPTLSQFRAQWPAESMGICQADTMVRNYCNDAQQRLLFDPLCPDEGWWGGWISMAFTVSVLNGSAYVTTPREVARLIDIAYCNQPLHIRNGFYEYLKYGAGLKPKTCDPCCSRVFEGYERDSVCTLFPLTGNATVRVYPTDSRDVGLRVLLQGLDDNGQTVLTTDPGTGKSAPGEYLVLQMPYMESANTFSTIAGVQKDETYGVVRFYQVNPTTLAETPLSSMEPGEGVAYYRRYLLNSVPASNVCCPTTPTMQITAQARLDFVPVQNETDYLTIPNVPALIEECRSIRFSRMDSPAAAQQSLVAHGRAIALLNGQLDAYLGKVNTAVRVPVFGSNPLTRQPV